MTKKDYFIFTPTYIVLSYAVAYGVSSNITQSLLIGFAAFSLFFLAHITTVRNFRHYKTLKIVRHQQKEIIEEISFLKTAYKSGEVGRFTEKVESIEKKVNAEEKKLESVLKKPVSEAIVKKAKPVEKKIKKKEKTSWIKNLFQGAATKKVDAEKAETDLRHLTRDITSSIRGGNFDVLLQPIVRIPERKVRYYECFSHLKDRKGDPIAPGTYLEIASQKKLIPTLDNTMLFRCLQMIHKAKKRSYKVSFFCNVSTETVEDEEFIEGLEDYLKKHEDVIPSLVLEFNSNEFHNAKEPFLKALRHLGALGCRFSLDQVKDMNFDVDALSQYHFEYVKIDASILTEELKALPFEEHKVKRALKIKGIDLIATKIEDETTLLQMLDHDVTFGQGFLFSVPQVSKH